MAERSGVALATSAPRFARRDVNQSRYLAFERVDPEHKEGVHLMSDDFDGLDLDALRDARAAEREGKQKDLPIRIRGDVIVRLSPELPLDVLTPLRAIDDTIALVIRQAMTLATDQEAASKWQATELVVDMLSTHEDLPVKVLEVIEQISRNLLTSEGVDKFMAAKPSVPDIKALALGIFRWYGVSLGESSPSSDSSTDGGGTSATTSDTNSGSTPEVSGPSGEPPTS